MTLSHLRRASLALLLFGVAIGPAHAQAIQSAMGSQARATVRITVSVRPTFTVSSPSSDLKVSSNTSTRLRYAVVVRSEPAPTPALAGESAEGRLSGAGLASAQDAMVRAKTPQQRLVLIVPD